MDGCHLTWIDRRGLTFWSWLQFGEALYTFASWWYAHDSEVFLLFFFIVFLVMAMCVISNYILGQFKPLYNIICAQICNFFLQLI